MNKSLLSLLAILITGPAIAATEEHFDYLDLAYSQQNTDFGDFGDSSSATVKASISAFGYLHVRGRYHDGNVRFPARVQQESWTVYGLGLHYPISNHTSVFLGSDHNELEDKNDRPTQRGWYHHIGFRHNFDADWQLGFELGETDVIFRDTTFLVEGVYSLTDHLGVSATLRDYDDLDLTEYEIGVRWFFR